MQEAQNYNGAPISMAPPNLVIESDASYLGWGASVKGQELRDRWSVVTKRAGDAHQLPRATGSISGNSNICQAEEHEYTGGNGQHLSQGLHEPLWGDSLMADEFISNTDMENGT